MVKKIALIAQLVSFMFFFVAMMIVGGSDLQGTESAMNHQMLIGTIVLVFSGVVYFVSAKVAE